MANIAKHIGRIGALAVALGVGIAAAPVSTASVSDTPPPPDTTALILCGTTCPTPNQFWMDSIVNKFVAPTHPDQIIAPVKVTAPMEFWPITGVFRVLGLALGPASIWGPGGPGWPDEPLWKLSGLFDLTADKSLEGGVAGLEDALAATLAANPDGPVVIYGNSQGAGIANVVKKRLAEQYPGPDAPDIDFVLGGDPNLPNGGLAARFPGLHIPILNLTMNGPAATDTQFDTVEINEQYDGFSDFPLYPLNFVADLNAVLGIVYVHMYGLDLSLPAENPTESPAYQYKHGDTSYYFFENPDLPLFGPLRTLGVPEPVIDVFEPFFRVIVEQGYDRSIPAWQPTPARLIPEFDPAKLTSDLVDAVGEGIDNAGALVKPAASLTITAPSTNTTVDEDVQVAELQTNESIGAVQSVDNFDTTEKSQGDRSNNSTPFTTGPTRQTPLRDAAKNLSSGIKKVVNDVSNNIKKSLNTRKRERLESQHEADRGQSADSTTSASS
ncbi:PE-PPE domain-containing protein [Mycobacterium sp. ITM-2016-00318]|uniref:PE-PPE domain-containing protein n=1 Tax=Mycobacterium sp. ITM-2016-00318 TaxID=2099693 RepID=UPI000CF859DE|nr:PE-PPE domain-containing protein [Mycobacterium sp. ITM-2016-00318]WNG94854.1 PE-PPE domain-containing protein [Mycobacterium sp. ITM-2016-00318]